jgi:hypothetical protein
MNEHKERGGQPLEKAIGAHSLRWEPPDLFIITLVGDLTGPQAREVLGDIVQYSRGGMGYFELVDLERLGSVSPEARSSLLGPLPPDAAPLIGAAVYGAGFYQRVLVSAMTRALQALRRDNVLPIAFFKTRAEAEAWIDARRRSRRS